MLLRQHRGEVCLLKNTSALIRKRVIQSSQAFKIIVFYFSCVAFSFSFIINSICQANNSVQYWFLLPKEAFKKCCLSVKIARGICSSALLTLFKRSFVCLLPYWTPSCKHLLTFRPSKKYMYDQWTLTKLSCQHIFFIIIFPETQANGTFEDDRLMSKRKKKFLVFNFKSHYCLRNADYHGFFCKGNRRHACLIILNRGRSL